MEKTHNNFFHWNDHLQHKVFLEDEVTFFRNLKIKNLFIWLKAKDIAAPALTVYLCFQFVANYPKLFICLGLVIDDVSSQQLLRKFDAVTELRMYKQLLKLIDGHRKQIKTGEEKESLKEAVVKKMRTSRV